VLKTILGRSTGYLGLPHLHTVSGFRGLLARVSDRASGQSRILAPALAQVRAVVPRSSRGPRPRRGLSAGWRAQTTLEVGEWVGGRGARYPGLRYLSRDTGVDKYRAPAYWRPGATGFACESIEERCRSARWQPDTSSAGSQCCPLSTVLRRGARAGAGRHPGSANNVRGPRSALLGHAGRSSFRRLWRRHPVYVASLAAQPALAANGTVCIPTESEWLRTVGSAVASRHQPVCRGLPHWRSLRLQIR